MTRFFARLLAFILALAFLASALLLIVNLRPAGAGGYVLIAILLAIAFIAPALIYRAMMKRWTRDHRPEETRVGAGLAMGTGIDPARQRRDDDDLDLMD